jgi:sugar phosphate isomerase/epimerase
LLELKYKYNLNYRCHNYFPPPKKHFVLNIASLNNEIFQASFDHLQRVIALSERLGAKKFAFHAGFFINVRVSEIGKKLSKEKLFNKAESIERFCATFNALKEQAKTSNVELFIENNVFSETNARTYNGENPLMMTSFAEYKTLKEKINFNLLLDVAHLKVSAKTLGLNWEDEFENMIDVSSYIHVSDNDSFHDLNNQLTRSSNLLSMLRQTNTKNKDFTLEIYDNMDAIKKSYEILNEVVS